MMSDNFLRQIIYWLYCDETIRDNIYLEGGAALHFLYEIPRRFSNDIDLTITSESKSSQLLRSLEKFARQCICGNKLLETHVQGANTISFKEGKVELTKVDFFVQLPGTFTWEYRAMNSGNMRFRVRTHSLIDIFAEKVANTLQPNRIKYKDVIDVPLIHLYLASRHDAGVLCEAINDKLVQKKLFIKSEKKLADCWQVRSDVFFRSFCEGGWGTTHRDFRDSYQRAYHLIESVLFHK